MIQGHNSSWWTSQRVNQYSIDPPCPPQHMEVKGQCQRQTCSPGLTVWGCLLSTSLADPSEVPVQTGSVGFNLNGSALGAYWFTVTSVSFKQEVRWNLMGTIFCSGLIDFCGRTYRVELIDGVWDGARLQWFFRLVNLNVGKRELNLVTSSSSWPHPLSFGHQLSAIIRQESATEAVVYTSSFLNPSRIIYFLQKLFSHLPLI